MKVKKRVFYTVMPSFCWLLLSVIVISMAYGFPDASGQSYGPAMMPLVYSWLLATLSVLMLIDNIRTSREPKAEKARWPSPLTYQVVALLVGFAIMLPILGFITTTAVFTTIALMLFRYTSVFRALALGLIFGFVLHVVFVLLMQVPLPTGLIG